MSARCPACGRHGDAKDALRQLMSELSEEYYCAGWLSNLEFLLWDILEGGSRECEFGFMSDEHLDELRRLSNLCGGWFCWSDELRVETFIPLDEWKRMYAARKGLS